MLRLAYEVVRPGRAGLVSQSAQQTALDKAMGWRHSKPLVDRRRLHKERTEKRKGVFSSLLRDDSEESEDEAMRVEGQELVVWDGGQPSGRELVVWEGARRRGRGGLPLRGGLSDLDLPPVPGEGPGGRASPGLAADGAEADGSRQQEEPRDEGGDAVRGDGEGQSGQARAGGDEESMTSSGGMSVHEDDEFVVPVTCEWDEAASSVVNITSERLVATAGADWNFQRGSGPCAVCGHVMHDTMKEYVFSLRILNQGSEGFNIGLSQLEKSEVCAYTY